VPVNTRWPIREVLEASFGYTRKTGRRLSVEYILIKDVNDQPWRADLLAKRLKGKLVHVNLIPLNPTPGSKWDASGKQVEEEFVRGLRAGGINATVRHTRGRSSAGAGAGACGQLAALG
jgi:23S rRNA (adenine2503-C2)-methyltransferase